MISERCNVTEEFIAEIGVTFPRIDVDVGDKNQTMLCDDEACLNNLIWEVDNAPCWRDGTERRIILVRINQILGWGEDHRRATLGAMVWH